MNNYGAKAPCKDCVKRHPCCHDSCEDYKEYRTAISSVRERMQKDIYLDNAIKETRINRTKKKKRKP